MSASHAKPRRKPAIAGDQPMWAMMRMLLWGNHLALSLKEKTGRRRRRALWPAARARSGTAAATSRVPRRSSRPARTAAAVTSFWTLAKDDCSCCSIDARMSASCCAIMSLTLFAIASWDATSTDRVGLSCPPPCWLNLPSIARPCCGPCRRRTIRSCEGEGDRSL